MKLYALILALAWSTLAGAAVGLDSSSVAKDCTALEGTLKQVSATQMSCQTKGYVVDFFLNTSNQVVHITWHGHTSPPLNTLLGSYTGEFKAAAAAHKPQLAVRTSINETPNVIVKRRGNARFHVGEIILKH